MVAYRLVQAQTPPEFHGHAALMPAQLEARAGDGSTNSSRVAPATAST